MAFLHPQYKSKVSCRTRDGPPFTSLTLPSTTLTFTHNSAFFYMTKMGQTVSMLLTTCCSKNRMCSINYEGLMIEYITLNSKRHLFTHYLISISIKCTYVFYVNCRSRLQLPSVSMVGRLLLVGPLTMAHSHYACDSWYVALGGSPTAYIMDVFASIEPTNY